MLTAIWQRLDTGARLCLPFAVALLCTLLSVMSWPLPYFGAVAPPLALIAVYYWTIHRPDLFRPWMAFTIGLLNDTVNFLPLGLTALLFTGAHQLVLSHRRYFAGHSFFMMWMGFTLTGITVMFAEWVLLCLIHWQWVPLVPVLTQLIFAITLFPLPCQLFIRMQRAALTQN